MKSDVQSPLQGIVSLFSSGGYLLLTQISTILFNPSDHNPGKSHCSLFSLYVVVSIRASGDPGLETLAGEPFVVGGPPCQGGTRPLISSSWGALVFVLGGRIFDQSPSSSGRERRVLVPGTPGADLAALRVPAVCHESG